MWWKSTIAIIFVLICIALILVFGPVGLKIGAHVFTKEVPGKLQYKKISGNLFGPYTIRDLDYSFQGNHLHINKLYLRWRQLDFKKHQVRIEKFQAEGVTWTAGSSKNIAGTKIKDFIEKHIKQAMEVQKKQQKTSPQPKVKTAQESSSNGNFNWNIQIKQAQLTNVTIKKNTKAQPLFIPTAKFNLHLNHKQVSAKLQINILKPSTGLITASLSGTPESYTWKSLFQGPGSNLKITGHGNKKTFQTDSFNGPLLHGTINGKLKITWQTKPSWVLKLKAENLKADMLLAETLPNSFSANLSLMQQKTLYVNLDSIRAAWQNGKKLQGEVHFYYKNNNEQQNFNNILINITSQNSYLKIYGDYDDQTKIYYAAQIPNIKPWLNHYHGQLTAKGRIFGSRKHPLLTGNLKANKLVHKQQQIKEINAQWRVDLSKKTPSQININLQNLAASPVYINSANLNLTGTITQQQLNASIINHSGSLHITTSGGIQNGTWSGIIKKLNLISQPYGNWKLQKSSNLSLSQTQWQLEPTCWLSAKGSLCLDSSYNSQKIWHTNIKAKQIALGMFNRLIGKNFKLNAMGSLNLHSSGIGKKLKQWQLQTNIGTGNLSYRSLDYKRLNLSFNASNLKSELNHNNITSSLHISLQKSGNLNAKIIFPNYTIAKRPSTTQKLTGSLAVFSNDLSPLAAFIPPALKTQGGLQINCKLAGTIGNPLINGKMQLINGEIILPNLGITLNNIKAIATANGKNINYLASLQSENRTLNLTGTASLHSGGIKTQATLSGNNVIIWDTPAYTVYATPKLKVRIDQRDVFLDGTLTIPQAIIEPPSFYNVTTMPEKTIIIRAGEKIKNTPFYKIHMKVRVITGKKVQFNAIGFKTSLSGNILINHEPKKTTLANGAINMNQGTYSLRGKTFTIERGALNFNNTPLVDPNLNLKASRTIRNYANNLATAGIEKLTVGFNVTGRLKKPIITLFSQPVSLSQANILSYLLFGYPSNRTNQENLTVLASSISSLSLNPTSKDQPGITERLSQDLHIDELGFKSDSVTDPILGTTLYRGRDTFTIGGHLSPRTYLRYQKGSGLYGDRVQLRYSLSPKWIVQANSNNLGSGGDLIYSFQRH